MKVQIVRTLCKGRFRDVMNDADPTNDTIIEGEEGVLGAYLRAIGKAKRFIYIENQYFVDPEIIKALVAQLKKEPSLELILLLNNWADIPFYSSSLPIPILGLLLDLVFEGRSKQG